MQRRETPKPPTRLEYIYQRQARQHTGIETQSLPQALAALTRHQVITMEVAHQILEDHAGEIVERDHAAYRDEDLKAQYAREMVRKENQRKPG